MIISKKKACLAAALIATSWFLCTYAGAQSLALTYNLDHAKSQTAKQAITIVNRCAGFNWLTSLGACGRDLMNRLAAPARPEDAAASRISAVTTTESGSDAAMPLREKSAEVTFAALDASPGLPELPTLGSPSPQSTLRRAGGKEVLLGNARSVDLMFRFGSKYRFRSADDGWEWYRFTDVGYDSRTQAHSHKALGVELLVPFH